MTNEYQADELHIAHDLDGIALKMLAEHFKLYQGYVKKANEIQAKIKEADKTEANGTWSYIGELKRQETFAVNGMKLHELYFGHLGGNGEPDDTLKAMIAQDFGSFDAWKEDMVATGISARGWAILCFDYRDNRLHTYGADAHNVGAVWGAIPLIALDVYEHAYFMEYGVNRKDYIAAFFKNLNWKFAEAIVDKFGLKERHGLA